MKTLSQNKAFNFLYSFFLKKTENTEKRFGMNDTIETPHVTSREDETETWSEFTDC